MSRAPFERLVGPAAALLLPNVDTDVIIRVERLTSLDPAKLAPFALEPLRYHHDGSENPDFVLNRDPFRGAPILLAGSNFGCGSSREPAVWALAGLGVRCIVAPSFGDIFRTNCFQNGLLAIALAPADLTELATAAADGRPVTVDLEAQQLSCGAQSWAFPLAAVWKRSLLSGRDDVDLALDDLDAIRAWESADRRDRPWAWNPVATPITDVTRQ